MNNPVSPETTRVERRGRVGWITLNRPQSLNALNAAMVRELATALRAFEADPDIGAIVVTGAGRAFSAGADITEVTAQGFPGTLLGNFLVEYDELGRTRKPMIAAVNGAALGGGFELALMCDLIVAADNARFGLPEIKLGTMPGAGGTQRLSIAIGKARAMDLCLTGRIIDAAEALTLGAISRMVPAAALLSEVEALADGIATNPLPATLAIKEAVNTAFDGLTQGLRLERRLFHSLFGTQDFREGMAAFIDKRAPRFEHR